MAYPNKEQTRALNLLRHIGWNWNLETLKKDVIKCWNIDENILEDENKGYSLSKGRLIAEIRADGRVVMGAVTHNGVPADV